MPLESLSVESMRRIEENCVGLGISKLQLMENAGKAIADQVRHLFKSSRIPPNKIVVVCGLGNNGGDGFVAARHLSREFTVHVVLVGYESALKTDEAQKNWDALKHLDCSVALHQGSAIFSPESPLKNLASYNILIDAILGTGFIGSVREPEKTVIQLINQSRIKKLSIDVPSGNPTETTLNANYVVALHRLKTGTAVKNTTICDIGIPFEAELYTGPGDILFHRNAESHKGENGRVLIIGGGPFTGAPTLAALAALRSGIDIVTVASPKAEIIAGFSPNLIVKEVGTERITSKEVKTLIDLIARHDSVVLGPGLGADPETTRAVSTLISASDNVTLDADGLSALATAEYKAQSITVTPHQGEFAALTGATIPSSLQERIEAVKVFSREWNVITLLKGRIDIISDGTKYRLNKTGNAGMTVGGTGDVLAGLVGAFSTRLDKMQAASTAAYVNGCAGDLAFSRMGYSLLATDVIDCIPGALSRQSQ
jgi:ADP-dependent NAD(P)H-hydrate dehydratase / NAD(P)H-hydrate epimerase